MKFVQLFPAPSLEEPDAIINGQNRYSFFNNCPKFNPKPQLESWEPQLFPQSIRFDIARAPGALIRQITVIHTPFIKKFSISEHSQPNVSWTGTLSKICAFFTQGCPEISK